MTEERRRADRFPIGLKVEFAGGAGLTRDVSGLGVFFETGTRFENGDEIDFALVIPEAVEVQCKGTIRRVEPRGDAWGVAVSITSYRLAEEKADAGDSPHLVIRELRRYHE